MLVAFYVCLGAIALTWGLSVVTREYSWVDRVWSLLPPIYAWIFAAEADFAARSVLMAALATAWGARLTFNFWRKGGYRPGGEDYRWGVLRKRLPAWAWPLFNLGFIAGYQNLLLFAFTLPAGVVAAHPAPLGPLDGVFTLAFLLFLAGETTADQQMWRFQEAKRRGETPEPFLRTGLFAWSRHPNFFCEQAQWWVYTLFPVAAGVAWLNEGLVGAVLLTLLFDGSTRFTEAISQGRYPSYADYQATTSRLLPWPPRGR